MKDKTQDCGKGAAQDTLRELWEAVHRLPEIYDFDSTQSADGLAEDLREILKSHGR